MAAMWTGFLPVVRWLTPAFASVVFSGCSPSPNTPLTRDVEVAISFAWTDAPQLRPANIEVGACAYEKAREPIAIARIRRDATVDVAWKEKQKRAVEIAKLQADFQALSMASAPPVPSRPGSQLRQEVEACRDTLNSLADAAVLYLEDVKQKLGAEFDKERVERFRKNLGADELRDLALAIKGENTPQVRKALADARAIIGREVWNGKAEERERGMRVMSELEKVLASAATSRPASGGVPSGAVDLKERIISVVKDQAMWENRLAIANRPIIMYTALGDAEVRAKTDGDGKCHLILPRDGRYVVFAYVDRPYPPGMSGTEQILRIGEKEEMVWILEAPGIGTERASITLSENNALSPGVAPLKLDTKGE